MGLQLGYMWPPHSEYHLCPYHIGIVVAEDFAIYTHQPEQRYTDSFDGKARARDDVKWLIARGDVVEGSIPTIRTIRLVTRMSQAGRRPGSVTIVLSPDERPGGPPRQLSRCSKCPLSILATKTRQANPGM